MKNDLKEYVNQINWLNTITGGVSMTAIQVAHDAEKLVISLSAPGVDPESFHIFVNNDKLTIHSFLPEMFDKFIEEQEEEEEPVPMFQRIFDIPNFVDSSHIQAVYSHGQLQVLLPFKDRDEAPRRIDIDIL
ncbi:Hsp20/alpha crystallin family protein [Cytophagaceae bacterium DM2B3-1]|uniref:Hsp20/alpha crystallin family protein n=1 Tax=Xanthocytophaga flava TaxID=3048013 RepID=A0ABT7CXM7_9BACT|nr:Hsp20/alpha crystallin family protein [Xanthocytophaga flavus]MDJ1466442.1 Hsp20/alpha crystallin family protein [Xanthocytophaga flavus]MDJ1498526.1 Hsp20/alpha crystallin family protein [Xanthocytophaga flavus]